MVLTEHKQKSILVIGGTGCISSAVVKECLKIGMKVTLINRGNRMYLIPNGVDLIKSDKNDITKIREAIHNKKYDAIIDFLIYTTKDLNNSLNLYASHCDQFFLISSCAVYDKRKSKICDENAPKVDERWEYSVTKWECEEVLRKQASKLNLNYTIIRPSMTYGETRIPYGIMPAYGYHGTLLQRIFYGKPIIRWNRGLNTNNIMHVDDFSRAFVLLIANNEAYNKVFNICGQTYTYETVLRIIEKKTGFSIIRHDIESEEFASLYPEKAGEILSGRSHNSNCVSHNFLTLFPNYKELISLEDGISQVIEAYKSKNYLKKIDYYFDGNWDRIINRTKNNKSDISKLRYVDYLNQSQKENFYKYLNGRFRDNLFFKFVKKIHAILIKCRHSILK